MASKSKISVNRRFQRSIRLDTDLSDSNALHGFICPTTFEKALTTFSHHVKESGQGAFTWTGPFGGGKSSLAVVLSALLSDDKKVLNSAKSLAGSAGKEVRDSLKAGSKGFRTLAVVGRKQDCPTLIAEAMKREGMIRKPIEPGADLGERVLGSLKRLSQQDKHAGLIVFIDEMGKVLEAAARGEGDLHFLQELAELASRSKKKLIVIGILHQSFGEYTGRLASRAREEWMKVQGRFVDIPLAMVADEQLAVLANAIESQPPAAAKKLATALGKIIEQNRNQKSVGISKSLLGCWPLNPVTAGLLGPYSRRRFGQNQRSIFSFLNSAEPHGFQAFLSTRSNENTYTVVLLWDYLRSNVEPSILASSDSHRWSTSLDALERCEAKGGSEDHIALVKTIALVEHFRDQSGFYPSREVLKIALPGISPKVLDSCIADLESWSIIAYRRHIDSYAIHAGSDFEIDSVIEDARGQQNSLDEAALRRLSNIKPVMAMRHYHETGAMRWLEFHILPVDGLSQKAERLKKGRDAVGHFIVTLPAKDVSEKEALKTIKQASSEVDDHLIVGMAPNGDLLNDLALEMLVVEQLQTNRSELSGDAVARREVEGRLSAVKSQFNHALGSAFLGLEWWHKGKKVQLDGRAAINRYASKIADEVYPDAPLIRNELLNRDKPSGSAMGGRRALLNAMVVNRGKERLGIQGYPAEGGLFASLIDNTGIYRNIDSSDDYRFLDVSGKDKFRLKPLWKGADKLLAGSASKPISVEQIYALWRKPPYGLKEGLLPVYCLAYILSRTTNLAVYLDGVYRPIVDDFLVDRLQQESMAIEFRQIDFDKTRKSVLSGLAKVVSEDSGKNKQTHDPLTVAQQLVATVMALPRWTHRTQTLTEDATKLRSIVMSANDPHRFLFDDLTQLGASEAGELTAKQIKLLIESIRVGLDEMTQAYPKMLGELRSLLLGELGCKANSTAYKTLAKRAENVVGLSGDYRLDAFATRLKTFNSKDDAIESIASLAANKPPKDWVDRDLDAARIEIASLAERFKKSEAFGRVKGRPDNRHSVAFVIGLAGSHETVVDEFELSQDDNKNVQNAVKNIEKVVLKSNLDKNVLLAALAQVGVDIVSSKKAVKT